MKSPFNFKLLTLCLLLCGASALAVGARATPSSMTPLERAALAGNDKLVLHLLRRGAPVNGRGPDNSTPLMAASIKGHKSTVRILLRYGANPTLLDDENRSAIDYAADTSTRQLLTSRSTDTQPEHGWITIATFSGDGVSNFNRNTDQFTTGQKWRLVYVTTEGRYGSQGSLVVFVQPDSGSLEQAQGQAIAQYGSGSGTALEYGAGKYHLQIINNQEYTIKVQVIS